MEISILKDAGFTDGEIKVYLALLELGSSTTGPIIEKSGVARSIIYIILEKLMQKGLVSYITKEKTKYFQSADPEKIIEYIDEREKRIKENRKKVENLIPELLLKQKLMKKNEANIYLGFDGIRIAHEHTYAKLKKGDSYYYLGIPATQPKAHHLYWQRDHVRRAKAGINAKLLFNYGTPPKVLKNRDSYAGCDARVMPKGIETPASLLIYKDVTTIILQIPSPIAVEIVSLDIAASFRSYAEDFWKKSVKYTNQ